MDTSNDNGNTNNQVVSASKCACAGMNSEAGTYEAHEPCTVCVGTYEAQHGEIRDMSSYYDAPYHSIRPKRVITQQEIDDLPF